MPLTAEDLDAACVPLLDQVRVRRLASDAEVAALVPATHDDVWAWLTCYGQLRAWLARPVETADDHAAADALVTRAITEAPIVVAEVPGAVVYPKSFATLAQLHILALQLDRFTAAVQQRTAADATLDDLDDAVNVITACTYVQQLLLWAWITPGPGLPWAVEEAQPEVPVHVQNLSASDAMHIARAVTAFDGQLAALQVLLDPVPVSRGGRRPSWSALFEALGAEAHIDPRDLAVTHSLGKVLAMTRLASERLRVPEAAA